jgi:transposase-like protein
VRRPYGPQFNQVCFIQGLEKSARWFKAIYSANTETAGRGALEEPGKIRNAKYPMIYKSRDRHWDGLSGFFKYPPETRRAVYTANAVEPPNCPLRQVTKNRPSFSTDGAILKILYLAV